VGAAFLGTEGTLSSLSTGLTETKSLSAPVPLIGTEFRLFPLPRLPILQVEGFMRGLPAASYGYFVEGGAQAGLRVRHVAFLAGYREMLANLHDTGTMNGLFMHLKGPIFSVQYHR
jgi:hypothetical protein